MQLDSEMDQEYLHDDDEEYSYDDDQQEQGDDESYYYYDGDTVPDGYELVTGDQDTVEVHGEVTPSPERQKWQFPQVLESSDMDLTFPPSKRQAVFLCILGLITVFVCCVLSQVVIRLSKTSRLHLNDKDTVKRHEKNFLI